MPGIFDGVMILDLSRLLPGPYCSLLFADLGARVIKVEEPGLGDYSRWNRPFWGESGIGASYLMLNRNKESLTLNLKTEEGKTIFRQLAAKADVLLESFRPGVMERLGLGAEGLLTLNPALIYCAITGYGQDGPYRDRVGHDVNYMGYAGALSITGERGRGPVIPGVQVADLGGGALLAAFAMASALYHRRNTGQGQFIDVAMTDGVVSWLAIYFGPFFATGRVPGRGEERLNGGWLCYGTFETSDAEFVTLGALEPKFWQNFCRLVGREEWIAFQYEAGPRRDALEAELRALFKTKTQAEWLSLLNSQDVCAGPVLDLEGAVKEPQLQARGLFVSVEHPTLGTLPQIAFPVKLSATPATIRTAPPGLGEQTEAVLMELGYSGREVARLRETGVI